MLYDGETVVRGLSTRKCRTARRRSGGGLSVHSIAGHIAIEIPAIRSVNP